MTAHRSQTGQNTRARQVILLVVGICLVLGGIGSAIALKSQDFGVVPAIWATPVQVNFSAPPLSLQDISGQSVSLENFKGKVVLLNNWATWCPPCKQEMPDLQRYYAAHQDDDFVLVAVDQSDPLDEVQSFVTQYRLTFSVWMDPQNQSLTAFANDGLPNSYVIDRMGTVRLAWTGAVNQDILEKFVSPLLEEK